MTSVYGLDGKPVGEIKLPAVFNVSYRPDIIKRAFLALQSHKRQPYGTDPLAGKRTSAHYHGERHIRFTMMNVEMARLPRSHSTTPAQEFRGRFVPQARSGRAPHPPKAKKVWDQKINKRERRLALQSSVAASANKELIKYEKELPIIITDELQKIKKTSDLEAIINIFGLSKGLLKAKKKKIRPGKGKMRGRKYRKKISLLFVIDKDYGIVNAATNLPGVDICSVQNLNVGVLAPGANPGRIVVWTESAIKKLDELFKV